MLECIHINDSVQQKAQLIKISNVPSALYRSIIVLEIHAQYHGRDSTEMMYTITNDNLGYDNIIL